MRAALTRYSAYGSPNGLTLFRELDDARQDLQRMGTECGAGTSNAHLGEYVAPRLWVAELDS